MIQNSREEPEPNQVELADIHEAKNSSTSTRQKETVHFEDNTPNQVQPTTLQPTDTEPKQKKGCHYWAIRILVVLIVLACIVLGFIYRKKVSEVTLQFLTWLRDHPYEGAFALVLVYITTTLAFVPGSLVTIGSAVAFQAAFEKTWLALLMGTTSVWLGAWIGSNLAMLLGRFVFREQVAKMATKHKLMTAIEKAIKNEGLKLTLLLRLCPLVPYNAFNYLMGATSVRFIDYAIGGVGMIPGTMVFVFIGTTIQSLTDAAMGNYEKGPVYLVLIVAGTVLAFAAIVYISVVVKSYLTKALDDQSQAENKEQTKAEDQDV